jgi:predicted flap endonuclease-1-like 5' DNA nuclease
VLDASIQAAHQQEPVPGADRDLLQAIPVNATPERPLLTGGQPVETLREAVTRSAERVRHRAWTATHRSNHPAWVTALSLREAADAGTVTSHHCHLLFRALADHSARAGQHEIRDHLLSAASQAEQARQRWLQTSHALRQVTTDPRPYLAPVASEARDLALASGRLVYADPAWTLASGPARSVRHPEDLVSNTGELPATVAAIHQACDSLTSLAHSEQDRVRAAAQAGRILVPVHSLPDSYDIPQPFAQAPDTRIDSLLDRYRDAEQASRQATAAAEVAAEATNAPSRIITAARAAAADVDHQAGMDHASVRPAERAEHTGEELALVGQFGPVEGTLRRLGVTHSDLLARGADLDRAGERLVIDAANDLGSTKDCPDAIELNDSAGATALINRVLVSGDPSAVALLRRPEPPAPKPPEREAEP